MAEPRLLRSILSNQFRYVAFAGISFFLSPFLVHRLGETDYGIWSLTLQTVGMLSLLDLGLNPAVVRFVARDAALDDARSLSRTLATCRAFFTCASAVIALLAIAAALGARRLYPFTPESLPRAQVCFLLAGLDLAVTFAFAVWNASLVGLHRFATINAWTVSLFALRTGFVVLAIRAGFGVRTVALASLVESFVRGLGLSLFARRALPNVDLRLRNADRTAFREVASYGVYAALMAASIKVITSMDVMIVGRFISPERVAAYDFGSKFVNPLYDVFWGAAFVLTPLAAGLDARGDREGLRRIHALFTKGLALLALPAVFFFVVAGRDFLRLWIGDPLAEPAYPVLALLTGALYFSISQQAGVAVLKGAGHVRLLALLYVGEAVANLVLSLLLVRSMGLVGVAIGTVVPLVVSNGLVMPVLVCRALGMPLRTHARETLLPTLLPGAVAFVVSTAALRAVGPVTTWGGLLAVLAGAAAAFWIPGFFLTLTRSERRSLLDRARGVLRARRSPAIVASAATGPDTDARGERT
jgi:O-antigen/teichoic acid export membrane protein